MPLRRRESHPESYSVRKSVGGDLGPKNYILARGHMGVRAESSQFVVPLEPAPRTPPPSDRPSRPEVTQKLKNQI